jgi:DNA-binding PadR family transcriptional regulator
MVAALPEAVSHFELAPPRRFVLPATLLLLAERPDYGYALVPRLQEFSFGHVDRPTVYRALHQLEQGGLIEALSSSLPGGRPRRIYRVTALAGPVLRAWMGVIEEEQLTHTCQAVIDDTLTLHDLAQTP